MFHVYMVRWLVSPPLLASSAASSRRSACVISALASELIRSAARVAALTCAFTSPIHSVHFFAIYRRADLIKIVATQVGSVNVFQDPAQRAYDSDMHCYQGERNLASFSGPFPGVV